MTTSNDSSFLKIYDFTDGSSQYTISIRNDLGLTNGLPLDGQDPNLIHTWLVISDKNNPDNRQAISFAGDLKLEEGIQWEVTYEKADDINTIGDHRFTEEFVFNISKEDFDKLNSALPSFISEYEGTQFEWLSITATFLMLPILSR